MADRATPSPQDEKLDALVSATAENTTTLLDVQKQAATTAASVKDARTYVQTIARQTSWETNGEAVAAILTAALEEDHEALHAASRAAKEMRGLSVELTRKADRAAETQQEASNKFHHAAERLLGVMEAHEQGKWRRMGMLALIGALCAAVGFFAREPANRYAVLWDTKTALKLNAADADCETLGGQTMPSEGRMVCVIWQDAAQGS